MKFNESYIPGLGKSGPVKQLVVGVAEKAASASRAMAPVDTGEYRDSIHVVVEYTPFRVIAKVVADSDHAMIVESKHGTLARGLKAAGG